MTHAGIAIAHLIRESWFWAGVLRDHATFIHDSLAPQEVRAAGRASELEQHLATLEEEARALARSIGLEGPAGSYAVHGAGRTSPLERYQGAELVQYERAARGVAGRLIDTLQALRGFKAELLQQKLDCAVVLHLTPSLLQHMIYEAEEGYRALTGVREAANLPPAMEALHHHILWLTDAAGHAAALNGGLDPTEGKLLEATDRFKRVFEGMEIKALELSAMLRIAPRMVGALRRLNRDALAEIATFRAFLAELREHLEGCAVMGTLTPLFADHMLREELYYTEKILALQGQES